MPVRRQQQVGRFDVTVENSMAMQEYQHLTQFFHKGNGLFFRQLDFRQIRAVYVFFQQCNTVLMLLYL